MRPAGQPPGNWLPTCSRQWVCRMPIVAACNGAKSTIVLTQDTSLTDLGSEGYLLEVTPKQITLKAPTQAGLFYGVQTLRQLFPPQIYSRNVVKGVVWKVPCVKIKDYPRFGWRGLMLDSGHDFQTLPFVYKFIDAMAAHKFNVLHWHLTDLGTWSIEIKKYPKLVDASTRGRGVKPGYYTQEEIRQVVKYAAERHITVVPEIEMPGHSVAALLAYPELNCPLKGGAIWQYCAGNEKSFEFLEDVLSEVIELFPSKYIHIGGDECPKDRWQQMSALPGPDEGREPEERERTAKLLHQADREVPRRQGPPLDRLGRDPGRRAGPQGQRDVVARHGRRNRGGQERPRRGDGPHQPPLLRLSHRPRWRRSTVSSRFPRSLTAEQARHVLGAQGQMWSDCASHERNMESLVYPRACALAEVVWSPAAHAQLRRFLSGGWRSTSSGWRPSACIIMRYRPVPQRRSRSNPLTEK